MVGNRRNGAHGMAGIGWNTWHDWIKGKKRKKKANMVLQPTSTSPFSLPRPISPCKAHERQVTLVTFSVGARGKTVLPRKDSLLSKSYHLNPLNMFVPAHGIASCTLEKSLVSICRIHFTPIGVPQIWQPIVHLVAWCGKNVEMRKDEERESPFTNTSSIIKSTPCVIIILLYMESSSNQD